jgi:hypothetical protein
MASINVQKSAASSKLSGFKNEARTPLTGSVNVSSGSVGAFSFSKHSFSITMPRENSVSSWRVRLTGLESFWRQVEGFFQTDKPNSASRQYSIQVQGYYSGVNFNVDVYFIDQSGSGFTRPACTVEAQLFTFVAPS